MKASFQADVRTISEAFFERIAHKMMVFSYETTDSACRVSKVGFLHPRVDILSAGRETSLSSSHPVAGQKETFFYQHHVMIV